MTDAEADAFIETACSTPHGRLKASYVLDDLNKIAPVYANPETRPTAEVVLAGWEASVDPLRKGLAMAWLSRARASLVPAVRSAIDGAGKASGLAGAGNAIKRGYAKASGKAGDLGAAAGEKLARSPLGAKSMAAAKQAGGEEARARMAQRLQPAPVKGAAPQMAHEQHPSARMGAAAPGPARGPQLGPAIQQRNFGAEQRARQGGTSSGLSNPADRTAAVHADALSAAFRSGAEHAANAHAGAAARMGRVAARHSFKAGMALAGAGAAVAGAGAAGGALSQAEHEERVHAAHAPRHHGQQQRGI